MAASTPSSRAPQGARAVECALLFVLVPGALAWARWAGRALPVLGLLLVAAAAAWVALLRDPGYDRGELRRWAPRREVWAWVGVRLALAAALLSAWVLVVEPQRWLELPRQRPGLWVAVMLLYPLLSVVPQELLFRCFFFRRYRALWGQGRTAVLASALAFAWAHALFLSWLSLALTLAGGWILARTFERTRSLPLVALEHALYGCLVFTVGLGRHFYAPL